MIPTPLRLKTLVVEWEFVFLNLHKLEPSQYLDQLLDRRMKLDGWERGADETARIQVGKALYDT